MRLLDLVTGDFVEFSSPSTTPPYAILSHRWDAVEQTYQDIRQIQKLCERNRQSSATPYHMPSSSSRNDAHTSLSSSALPLSIWDSASGLSNKIRGACEVARTDGFYHLWIDSCCIDKTSSSELSESINSMFAWYRDAEVCYTFLADVPTSPVALLASKGSAFRASVWFTRGWTLQELIAPRQLVFLSQTWEPLGTKASLPRLVEEITGVPVPVLIEVGGLPHKSLDECSVAQRMSWAANRTTTKVEDQAYSLLGIFDIQMPPLYGEGKRAFRRLQEEILRRIPDQTIFAWGNVHPGPQLSPCVADKVVAPDPKSIRNLLRPRSKTTTSIAAINTVLSESRHRPANFYASGSYMMLADSPADFAHSGQTIAVRHNIFRSLLAKYSNCKIPLQEYTFAPYGIRTDIPLLPLADCLTPNEDFFHDEYGSVEWYLAILACERSDFPGQLLCCICHLPALPEPLVNTLRRGYLIDLGRDDLIAVDAHFTLVRWSLSSRPRAWPCNFRPHTVYLDHSIRSPPLRLMHCFDPAGSSREITFALPTWSRGALDAQGYATSLTGSSGAGTYSLTLSPRPPRTTSNMHRWAIAADFSCACERGGRTLRAVMRLAGGNGASFTQSWEWQHIRLGTFGWHRGLMHWSEFFNHEGREGIRLELGVQLASVACYRIHVRVIVVVPPK